MEPDWRSVAGMVAPLPLQAGGSLVALALLLLCGIATGTELYTIVGEVGGNVTLPCRNLSVEADKASWFKEGSLNPVIARNWPEWDLRLQWENQTSMQIIELQQQDQGNYMCTQSQDAVYPVNAEPQIRLLVASGPSNTSVVITPSRILPNGTFYTPNNSFLEFVCLTNAYPVPNMRWVFNPPGSPMETWVEANDTTVTFSLKNIPQNYQGNYTCSVNNWLSQVKQEVNVELLVYVQPESKLKCWAENSQVWPMVDLKCSWSGGYPQPVFKWQQDGRVLGHSESTIAGLGIIDEFVITLNKTDLKNGQQFDCLGSHILVEEPQTCTVHISLPTLEPQPMKVCLLGQNVTFVCLTTATNPPANFTWLKNLHAPQIEIQPSEKYLITQNATLSLLTIQNCSKDLDAGYYVCRVENPLGVRELDIWLTVHSPSNIIGLVAALVILFTFAIGSITILILYCNPEFCLKAHSRARGTGDVMVLMDSEDEEEEVVEAERPTSDDVGDTVQVPNGNVRHAVICHSIPESVDNELESENSTEEEIT